MNSATPKPERISLRVVLSEDVSPGSEGKDRLIKRIAYQRLPSLKNYVLVERDRPFIDHYIRPPEGWRGELPLETLDEVLKLLAIELEMPVGEIYRDVMPAPA
jgi:Uma2 family endonuclease